MAAKATVAEAATVKTTVEKPILVAVFVSAQRTVARRMSEREDGGDTREDRNLSRFKYFSVSPDNCLEFDPKGSCISQSPTA